MNNKSENSDLIEAENAQNPNEAELASAPEAEVDEIPFAERDILVSVVMPVYNACGYLRPAIESIMAQTLTNIEIICVDDGSTDTSLDMIKIFQKNDDRIRIITETNAGPGLARNNGLKRARGE